MNARIFASLAAITVAAMMTLGTGCSSDDGGDGSSSSSSALASCKSLCDAEAKGTGCTAKAGDTCKQFCDAVGPALTGDCGTAADAYYKCAAGLKYTCSQGSDLAVSTDKGCDAQSEAYNKACAKK